MTFAQYTGGHGGIWPYGEYGGRRTVLNGCQYNSKTIATSECETYFVISSRAMQDCRLNGYIPEVAAIGGSTGRPNEKPLATSPKCSLIAMRIFRVSITRHWQWFQCRMVLKILDHSLTRLLFLLRWLYLKACQNMGQRGKEDSEMYIHSIIVSKA